MGIQGKILKQSVVLLSLLCCGVAAYGQAPVVQSLVSGASFAKGMSVAPGSIISIFGQQLADAEYTASSIPLPTKLGGTSASINGQLAPLFFVSPGQINAQIPFEIQPGSLASVVVQRASSASVQFSFAVAKVAPAIFLWSQTRGVIQNQDAQLNTAGHPAKPNEVVTVYLTGQGGLDSPVKTGMAAPAEPLSRPIFSSSASIGGRDARLEFLGLAPGYVGLAQANIRVPNLTTGEQTLTVTIGGVRSNIVVVSIQSAASAVMQFVPIPAGEFIMGCSPGDDECLDYEKPAHRVRITKPFELGIYEVTQEQWAAVMGNNPSSFIDAARSVDSVSWDDIREFLIRLNGRNDGYRYRLPTEAEWEYAARAGTSGRYSYPIGQGKPNAWGLYNMLEDIAEWCQDWYDHFSYTADPVVDPKGPDFPVDGTYKVVRGDTPYVPARVRVSYRTGQKPDRREYLYGFRCVREKAP